MAIIDSMTPQERRNPDMLKASRKRRIAAGSGTKPEDINRLLKMHRTMADMMKAMGGAKRGPMAGLANMLGLGGGMPSAGADGEARGENAGGPAADDARLAAEFSRLCRAGFAGLLVRSCRAACRRDSRLREEEVT